MAENRYYAREAAAALLKMAKQPLIKLDLAL
jgi:hypothetical protein